MNTGDLATRLAALDRFLAATTPHIRSEELSAARAMHDRAIARLGQSGEHTIVALVGATGSGKSSLFNALARMPLSPTGYLRPTTSWTHACVWGGGGADTVLAWLGVSPERRLLRESPLDGDDEAALRGLVLLDLPDFDSVSPRHRAEADRVIALADLVIWVLDPQKYADRLVHEGYLQQARGLGAAGLVVVNQIDRVSPEEAGQLLVDVERLLDADGVGDLTVVATSTLTDEGVAPVRQALEAAVAAREAAVVRLAGDLDSVVAELKPLIGPELPATVLGPEALGDLTAALATAAGVEAVVVSLCHGYRRRAAIPGVSRRRLPDEPDQIVPAQAGLVGLAVRKAADDATEDLPGPWREAARAAARTSFSGLPDALSRALTTADATAPRALGWLVMRVAWWVTVMVAVAGFAWLVGELPVVGRSSPLAPSLMLAGGATLAVVGWLAAKPAARAGSARLRGRTEARLHAAVAEVASDQVMAPLRGVLDDYRVARTELSIARS